MQESELKKGYHKFGNKGACWSNEVHITKSDFSGTTLCGVPTLSSNWARIWEHDEIKCPECLKLYENHTKEDYVMRMTDEPDGSDENWTVGIDKMRSGEVIEVSKWIYSHFLNGSEPKFYGVKSFLSGAEFDDYNYESRYFSGYADGDKFYGCFVSESKYRNGDAFSSIKENIREEEEISDEPTGYCENSMCRKYLYNGESFCDDFCESMEEHHI